VVEWNGYLVGKLNSPQEACKVVPDQPDSICVVTGEGTAILSKGGHRIHLIMLYRFGVRGGGLGGCL
jgi:hypothetical protein